MLLNVSENATYRVDDPVAGPKALRVTASLHRAITSELAWMDGCGDEAGVRTPRVVPATNGDRVVALTDAGRGRSVTA